MELKRPTEEWGRGHSLQVPSGGPAAARNTDRKSAPASLAASLLVVVAPKWWQKTPMVL